MFFYISASIITIPVLTIKTCHWFYQLQWQVTHLFFFFEEPISFPTNHWMWCDELIVIITVVELTRIIEIYFVYISLSILKQQYHGCLALKKIVYWQVLQFALRTVSVGRKTCKVNVLKLWSLNLNWCRERKNFDKVGFESRCSPHINKFWWNVSVQFL